MIALAAIAIIIAGWMSWRYIQLRRSVEGSAWWSGNTIQQPSVRPGETLAVDSMVDAPLGGNTRFAGIPARSQTDVRASGLAAAGAAAAAGVVSNIGERPRPPAKNARYAAQIATDFTVSDIEAAMATVRTVSPPRPVQPPLDDSDFAPLGGHSLPSPFADPPQAPPRARGDAYESEQADLDIPPMDTTSSVGRRIAGAPRSHAESFSSPRPPAAMPEPVEETPPLDFRLDIPENFDPLSTNSMKTTIVDRPDPESAVDFELPASVTTLDFELPAQSAVAPLSDTSVTDTEFEKPARQAASALDDIFPSLGGPSADTILNLDERDNGGPLTTTEVDRLTSTEVEGGGEFQHASTQYRMARFADLMNQVDEEARADPLRAIAQLRQYVLRDEQIPTLLWLRLFELYRQVDKRPVYEALGEHFARRYHRVMIGWDDALGNRVPQTPLAALPAIDQEIEAKWGSEEGLERLRQLLCDRDQPDTIVFNAVLQRDLLDAAKVFPIANASTTDFGAGGPKPPTT